MKTSLISVSITLFLLSLFTRIGPILIGNFLQRQTWISKLSKKLPCMILTLLLIFEIEMRSRNPHENTFIIISSIALTLLIHLWMRQVVLSISVGVAAYAFFQYFF